MTDRPADINSPTADQSTQQQVSDLLSTMIRKEAKGLLWASGPFAQPGVLVGDGLTIFRTASLEEARQLDLNASKSTFDLG